MSNLYLILDLLILAGPLALSFDKRVAFHTKWGPHGLPVGDGSGGESVMPPQQRKIIAMRA
jgi:hypothetical protein